MRVDSRPTDVGDARQDRRQPGALPARATTEAVILARGLGTRMRRSDGTTLLEAQRGAADAGAKSMIPVGRPFLEYVISALADAGIREVVLVVGPESTRLRDHFTRVAPPTRTTLRFAVQEEPRGTADAVLAARDLVGNGSFLVLNADNYYPVSACAALAACGSNGLVAFEATALVRESGIEPARVLRYAFLDIAADDTLRAIREKPAPDDPLAERAERWVSMNLWSFTPVIFEACARVGPSPRGELEIQDAVTIAMRDLGQTFRVMRARTGVLDLSHRADVATVTTRLARIEPRP
jgi:UDP-N-acetylglucosamine diphosphorylase / glucose-1-phosphate thymidylyltransferase / UDP-N-acetylgalactosamine diphosphorylase / glucosamine-1-phosphate N-acetyltransferase / galactosamine-1-phosphate N-acetyltransferase